MGLITESPYLQFFIGLSGYQATPPFDPSMMVHFRKRIGPDLIKICNDMTKANGIAMIQELLVATEQEDGTDPGERKQLAAIEEELGVKPASLEPGSNWGTLILDATPERIPDFQPAANGRPSQRSGYSEFAEALLTLSGIAQNSLNVGGLQIREISQDVGLAHAAGEILEHIGNRDARSGQARFAAAHARRAAASMGWSIAS